jgi:uncharacterized protein (TIGR03083 family)
MGNIIGTEELTALTASVERLRELVSSLGLDERRAQAYPSEWTVADVLSHLGSGAVISTGRVDEVLGGHAVEPEPIWAEWNAKDPDAKTTDALAADRAFIERLEAMTDNEREQFSAQMGPMTLDLPMFLRLRLNEHTLHSWDIAVTFTPDAELAGDAVGLVLETIPMIAGFAGKPTGKTTSLLVATTEPDRRFVIKLTAEGVSLSPTDDAEHPDLELPAEALIRLVYGRLDPDHTPTVKGADDNLNALRRAFPGV